MAYVQQGLTKTNEKEKAKATIFKLPQHEQFVEEMKSLNAEKISKMQQNIAVSIRHWLKETYSGQRLNKQKSTELQCNATINLEMETSRRWFILA